MMTLPEFRSYRDRFALASMLERSRKLEALAGEALNNVRHLRKELAKYPAPPAGLQYGLTKEQFDERIRIINIREKIEDELNEAYKVWANLEAAIGDIERDSRYQAWAEAQRRTA